MNELERNRSQIKEYLLLGCKSQTIPMRFGVELEHFIVESTSMRAVSYYGKQGVEAILRELMDYYDTASYSKGHLIALAREGIALSLEPAAQLEVSIAPKTEITDIRRIYDRFYEELQPILERYSYRLVTMGYQPNSKAAELELLPKTRYRYMDAYFDKISEYGRQMMRGTAAAQVSIDYYSEDDFKKKYKLAYRLKTVLAYICSNSPRYEKKDYQGFDLREKIWENTDKRRVDITPFLEEDTLSFAAYTDFVLQTPVIVNKEGTQESYDERTIGEIAAERIFTQEEIAHMLSMVFPMIRVKKILELRFADSMPIEDTLAYVVILKGLFLDLEASLEWAFSKAFAALTLKQQAKYLLDYVADKAEEHDKLYLMGSGLWK